MIIYRLRNYFDIDESIIDRLKQYDDRFAKIFSCISNWQLRFNKKAYFINGVAPINEFLPNEFVSYSIAPLLNHINEYNNQNVSHLVELILNPESEATNNADRNSISSIIYLQRHDLRLTFGGDAPARLWLDAFDLIKGRSRYKVDSQFVKVSHHGSKNSSDIIIWDHITKGQQSLIAAISAGSKYDHPDSETIDNICQACINKGLNYSFISTNLCNPCLANLGNNHIDYDLSLKKLNKITSILLKSSRSKHYANYVNSQNDFGKGLFAFKIDFNLDDFNATTSLLWNVNVRPNSSCKFDKHFVKPVKDCYNRVIL
ncbi:hypothetical protein GO730_39165 [Spirosoma sp. HMF3257]|uniref:Uncharacterized protein n=1 Tax=Spirosoma telluris TaxID=2183553 RepID=A0A327NDX6_9BACT|nr:hypothetical protein [Spirosoma telluris]RAI72913.1 hypothetical protein HMF3257_39095 [Spirosoma telluris]